jgi:hypothetical protein
MSTVTFNSQSNTNCSLVFIPTNGSVSTVNIGPIQFPFTFDPEQYGLGVNEINGTYTFTCGDCVYTRVVNEVFTTTTTAAPTTTTTTTEEPTTTTTTTEEPTTTTTTTLPTLTCEDVTISLNGGKVDETVSGSVNIGRIQQISPSTYVAGTNSYGVTILVPSGYDNEGQLIECPSTATGIVTTTTTTTTERPTTTTTTTELGGRVEGKCRNIFIRTSIEGDGIDQTRYGLSWNHPIDGVSTSTFSSMLGTPTNYYGMNGAVFSVCSTLGISDIWDSQSNTTVSPNEFGDNVVLLSDGGVCDGTGLCVYEDNR